jgi:cytoskeletal protein CcmA (bactofilin family)
MTYKLKVGLQTVLLAALVMVLFFGLAQPASAQGIVYGDTVPQGVTLNNDIILVGDDVLVDGNVNGNILAIGRTVNISGTVDGSAIILAGLLDIRDVINGSLYNASGETRLGASGKVGKDLYFAGGSLDVKPEASIGRDLYAFTGGAQLTKNIGRDVVAIVGPYEMLKVLYQALNGKFGLPKLDIPFLTLAPSGRQASLAAAAAAPFSLLGLGSAPQAPIAQSAGIDWSAVGDWAMGRLLEFVTLLVIGGLLLWLVPWRLEAWVQRSTRKPWMLMLYGLGYVIIAFAGAAVILFLIIILAYGLAFIHFTNLAFLVGMLGMLAVGLAFFIFVLFAFYVSKVVVADMFGGLILRKLAPKARFHRFWPFLLGLFLYVLLVSIPYLGFVLAFLAVLLGFGAIVQVVLAERAAPAAVAEVGEMDAPQAIEMETPVVVESPAPAAGDPSQPGQ